MNENLTEIEIKLSAARTRLILDRPFMGALVMHLPLAAADPAWCQTTATDARAFYYNPAFIATLTLSQTQFILAHEALHCALGHFSRRQHRTRQRWDVACDHAVNLLLVGEGLKPPPGALLNNKFKGLTAEEIYPLIEPDTTEHTLDRHVFDDEAGGTPSQGDVSGGGEESGDGQTEQGEGNASDSSSLPSDTQGRPPERHRHDGPPTRADGGHSGDQLNPKPRDMGISEREEQAALWRQRLASAAQQAHKAGRLAESWLRVVDDLIQPRLPWRALLAQFVASAAKNDYSFQRRSHREGEAILPALFNREVDLVVAIDTSGSISDEEMRAFAAEVDALKGQARARISLLACDECLDEAGPWTFEPWEPLVLPAAMAGGGGTDFRPVFRWVEQEQRRPDLLLYFTDGEGDFPDHPPGYPVVWVVKGRAPVPWGDRIQLND